MATHILERKSSVWLCLVLWAACGCSVDDRVLAIHHASPPPPDHDAAPASMDAQADSSVSPGDSGSHAHPPVEAGAAGSPAMGDGAAGADAGQGINPLPVDECDVAAKQITIVNPTFNSDASGWNADSRSSEAWSTEDAHGKTNSGSLAVTNEFVTPGIGVNTAGAYQCVAIAPDTGYEICIDYVMENTVPDGAAATVDLMLFNGDNCAGTMSASANTVLEGGKGTWKTLRARMVAPPQNTDYKSMLVKLAAVKPNEATSLQVLFDNVRIGASSP